MTQLRYRDTSVDGPLRNIFYGLCVITALAVVGFVAGSQKNEFLDAHTRNVESIRRVLMCITGLVLVFFISRWAESKVTLHEYFVRSALLMVYLVAVLFMGWEDILRFYLYQLIMIGIGLVILAVIGSIARSDRSQSAIVTYILQAEIPVALIFLVLLYYLQKWGIIHLSSRP